MGRYQTLLCGQPIFQGTCGLESQLIWSSILFHHQRIWEFALTRLSNPTFYTHIPLWFNHSMPELLYIPDPIIYLHQLFNVTGPKTFTELQADFAIPNYVLFWHPQLSHAIKTQFPNSLPTLTSLPLVDIWAQMEPNSFQHCITHCRPQMLLNAHTVSKLSGNMTWETLRTRLEY